MSTTSKAAQQARTMGELRTVMHYLVGRAMRKVNMPKGAYDINSTTDTYVFESKNESVAAVLPLMTDIIAFHTLYDMLLETIPTKPTDKHILAHIRCSAHILDGRIKEFKVELVGDYESGLLNYLQGEPVVQPVGDVAKQKIEEMSALLRSMTRVFHDTFEASDKMRAELAHKLTSFERRMAMLGADRAACSIHVPDPSRYREERAEPPAKRYRPTEAGEDENEL